MANLVEKMMNDNEWYENRLLRPLIVNVYAIFQIYVRFSLIKNL